MAEEDHPAIADELVEVDGPVGGVGIEVWCCVTEAERLGAVVGTHDADLEVL